VKCGQGLGGRRPGQQRQVPRRSHRVARRRHRGAYLRPQGTGAFLLKIAGHRRPLGQCRGPLPQRLLEPLEQGQGPPVTRNGAAHRQHPLRLDRLDDYRIVHLPAFQIDLAQPCLDPVEPGMFLAEREFQLCPPQAQHAAQFLRCHRLVQQAADLLEAEPEILERQYPVQARQLLRRIVAVPGIAVDPLGL